MDDPFKTVRSLKTTFGLKMNQCKNRGFRNQCYKSLGFFSIDQIKKIYRLQWHRTILLA